MKSQILAIAHSAMLSQIYKISPSGELANKRLQGIGFEMGIRLMDEYAGEQIVSKGIEGRLAGLVKGAAKQYLGAQIQILDAVLSVSKKDGQKILVIQIQYKVRQAIITDSVSLPAGSQLNLHSLLIGFVCGCSKTMGYFPTAAMANEDTINLSMWKFIIQQ